MTTDCFSNYRTEFPITNRCAFLSHAAVSPLNRRTSDALRAFAERMQHDSFLDYFHDIMSTSTEFRERLATLINARNPDEIVMMPNTATGINTAAVSLPLNPGDNVLILDGDYPANVYPWQNLAYRGVLTKVVPTCHGGLDIDVLEQRIDAHTRVIAMSTVMFSTGFRNDIAAVGQLCKDRGIYFVVDGIQSLGAFPLDVQACHIDFLAAGSHKWLLSTPGCGFLYCRHDILDELVPGAYVGAGSVVDPMNFLDYNLTYPDSADRFNTGSQNWAGMVALNASLGLLLEVGIARISEQILTLIGALIDDLTRRGYTLSASTEPQHRSGIVVAQTPDADAICKTLQAAGIVATARGGGVRVAPHFYNTLEEVLRVGEVMGQHRAG